MFPQNGSSFIYLNSMFSETTPSDPNQNLVLDSNGNIGQNDLETAKAASWTFIIQVSNVPDRTDTDKDAMFNGWEDNFHIEFRKWEKNTESATFYMFTI